MQSEQNVSEHRKKITFSTAYDISHVAFCKYRQLLPVRMGSNYKEGQYFVCRDACPLALGCAIKRARQLHRALTDDVQDGVVMWTRDLPDCYGTLGCPVRLNCNAPLFNIGEDKWRTSWCVVSCWNHTTLLDRYVALQQSAIHIVDHDVVLDINGRKTSRALTAQVASLSVVKILRMPMLRSPQCRDMCIKDKLQTTLMCRTVDWLIPAVPMISLRKSNHRDIRNVFTMLRRLISTRVMVTLDRPPG